MDNQQDLPKQNKKDDVVTPEQQALQASGRHEPQHNDEPHNTDRKKHKRAQIGQHKINHKSVKEEKHELKEKKRQLKDSNGKRSEKQKPKDSNGKRSEKRKLKDNKDKRIEKRKLKEEKRKLKEAKKKEKIRRKRAQIEKYLSRPLYQRILIRCGFFLAKMMFILICFVLAVMVGLMVGMGVVGDARPTDALDPDVWRHIYRLIFPN